MVQTNNNIAYSHPSKLQRRGVCYVQIHYHYRRGMYKDAVYERHGQHDCMVLFLNYHHIARHEKRFPNFLHPIHPFSCHNTGGNQEWVFTKRGQIKHDDLCLTLVQFARGSEVVLKLCDESENQRWKLLEGDFIQHAKLNVCLDSRNYQQTGVTAQRCNSALDTQHWTFVRNKYA